MSIGTAQVAQSAKGKGKGKGKGKAIERGGDEDCILEDDEPEEYKTT